MKKSRVELKLMAKQALMGNYGAAVGAILILGSTMVGLVMLLYFVLIGMILGATAGRGRFSVGMGIGTIIVMFIFIIAIYLVEYMVIPGLIKIYHNLCMGKKAALGDLLYAFKNSFGKFFGLSVILVAGMIAISAIQFVITFFGSELLSFIYMIILMVLSIVISLNFGLFYYILVEDPSIGVIESLKLSVCYMKGNKWRYFVLGLSFAGWFILSYMTCYIALIWLVPYMGCTYMNFYFDVKAEHNTTVSGAGTNDFQAEFYDISSKENVDA